MLVETGCRLHLGLIDLNGGLGRIDGGVGLGISDPGVTISAKPSNSLDVSGTHSQLVQNYASTLMEKYELPPAKLNIESVIPRHVGLGSGTQLALATGSAMVEISDIDVPVTELADHLGRGGTSGIGTAVFERGGFVLDGGHSTAEKDQFLPSSASKASPPPVISRLEFPDWNIRIYQPRGSGKSGEAEKSVFQNKTPIPIDDVRHLSHVVLMKLLPSVAESDFQAFREAVEDIQNIGWKRFEVKKKPKSKQIINQLSEKGVAAGLSSWGPVVYGISPDSLPEIGINCQYFDTSSDNQGATISD
jgi:beta-ribofuranosylaminobenzene 5'-phosphate synthase